ncbi:MAG: hypothetical protein LBB09_02095 [Rickettsiales bacterium]|nr:hypothetical protein [Rickettsiales bacterium]
MGKSKFLLLVVFFLLSSCEHRLREKNRLAIPPILRGEYGESLTGSGR